MALNRHYRNLMRSFKVYGGELARIQFSSVIPMPPKELFSFLFREESWERGLPPQFDSDLVASGPFREKTVLLFRLARYGFSFNWGLKIDRIHSDESVQFLQSVGPFESWSIEQKINDHGDGESVLSDLVDYKMPLGLFGCIFDDLLIKKELTKLLESRHEKILQLTSAVKK